MPNVNKEQVRDILLSLLDDYMKQLPFDEVFFDQPEYNTNAKLGDFYVWLSNQVFEESKGE